MHACASAHYDTPNKGVHVRTHMYTTMARRLTSSTALGRGQLIDVFLKKRNRAQVFSECRRLEKTVSTEKVTPAHSVISIFSKILTCRVFPDTVTNIENEDFIEEKHPTKCILL